MPFSCKGICDIPNQSNNQFIIGYDNGQRYCRTCVFYPTTDSFRCNCCNQVLRQTSRYQRGKII